MDTSQHTAIHRNTSQHTVAHRGTSQHPAAHRAGHRKQLVASGGARTGPALWRARLRGSARAQRSSARLSARRHIAWLITLKTLWGSPGTELSTWSIGSFCCIRAIQRTRIASRPLRSYTAIQRYTLDSYTSLSTRAPARSNRRPSPPPPPAASARARPGRPRHLRAARWRRPHQVGSWWGSVRE